MRNKVKGVLTSLAVSKLALEYAAWRLEESDECHRVYEAVLETLSIGNERKKSEAKQ
jgi:hypothetical protein